MLNPAEKPIRIVSRAKFAGIVMASAGLKMAGCLLVPLGLVGVIILTLKLTFRFSLASAIFNSAPGVWIAVVFALVLFAIVVRPTAWLIEGLTDRVYRMEPAVPHTRHTIASLPAKQSLVRASAPPEGGDVLLRASAPLAEDTGETLLRAGDTGSPSSK